MKQTKITSILEKQRKRYHKHLKEKFPERIRKKVKVIVPKKTKEEIFSQAKDLKSKIMTNLMKNKMTPSFRGKDSSVIEFNVLQEIENELGTDNKNTPNETRFSSLNTTPMLDASAKSLILEGNYLIPEKDVGMPKLISIDEFKE